MSDYMADALDEVVDTIMDYGEWPKPRKGSRPCEFWLGSFLERECQGSLLLEWAVNYFLLDGPDLAAIDDIDDARAVDAKLIRAMLRAHLRDSKIVQDHAAELEREETEEQ